MNLKNTFFTVLLTAAVAQGAYASQNFTLTIENSGYDNTCYKQVRTNYSSSENPEYFQKKNGLEINVPNHGTISLPDDGESVTIKKVTLDDLYGADYSIKIKNGGSQKMAHPLYTFSILKKEELADLLKKQKNMKITVEKGKGVEKNGAGECYPAGVLTVLEN